MKKFSVIILLLIMLAICAVSFADTVQIGTGTATTSYLPIYGLYGYTYSQQIYTQAQINKAGNITKLRFFYVSGTITNSKDWVIYMGHTTKTTFSSTTDWEPLANLTQVFAGDVSSYVPLANNWMEIPLTTPFNYNNTDNLVIAVDENTSDYASMSWGAFTSGDNTGIYYRSDSVNPDPADPPTASGRTASIDRIQLVFPNSSAPLAPTLLSPANGGWAFTDGVLTWTPTSGAGDTNFYDVYFGTTSNPPLVSSNQTATSYTPTLAAGTTYYWKVVAKNEIGDSPASDIWSFQTPITTQLAESFETTPFPPAGWANPGSWSSSTSYAKHGTKSAYKYGSTTSQYILSTPKVTITSTSTLDLWTLCSTTTGTLQILYSPDRTTWTQVGADITHAATYTWYNTVVDLGSLAGNNYYLGIRTGLQSASFYIDLVVGPEITPEAPGAPTLSVPADLATGVNEYIQFTWTAPTTGGVPTGYKLYCDTNNPPTTLIADLNALTYTLTTPLAYNTTYYWTVLAYNGSGNGPTATVRSFTTRTDPTIYNFPYTAGNFENSGSLPLNWIASEGATGASYHWAVSTAAASHGPSAPHSGTYFGWLYCYLASTSYNPYYLTTPPIALDATAKRLTYWYWIGTDTYANPLFVEISTDNQANWTTLYTHSNTSNTLGWFQNTISLASYTSTTVYLRFKGMSNYGSGMTDLGLDDIVIEDIPAAPIFSYAPTSINFGMIQQNLPATPVNVTVTNTGGGTLNLSSSDIIITGPNAAMFSFNSDNLPATLGAGQSVNIPVSVTVTQEGPVSATLTITYNDTPYNVALSAEGLPVGIVIIGTGTLTQRQPFGIWFGYERSAALYTNAQIGSYGLLNKVAWNCATVSSNAVPYKIYAMQTNDTALTSITWSDFVATATLVDTGTHTFNTTGWYLFELTTPFTYTSGNLVIGVETYFGGSGTSPYPYFYYTSGTTGCHQYWNQDNTPPTSTGTLNTSLPNVMLQFGELPSGAPDPVTLNYPVNGATGIPQTGFNLTWTRALTGGIPSYYAVYMSQDEDTIYDDYYWETTNTSFNPVTEGGITFNYLDRWYWTVEAINDDGSAIVVPPYSFEIRQAPIAISTFPWSENFDASLNLPTDWTMVDVDGAGTYWQASTAYSHSSPNSFMHSYSALVDDGQNGWLITPAIQVPATGHYVLSWWNYNVYPSWMVYNGLKVNTTDDPNDPNWVELWAPTTVAAAWSNAVVNITPYAGQIVYFAFNYQGYDADDWYIDDVSIYELLVDEYPPVITHLPILSTPRNDTNYLVYAEIADDPSWNNPIGGASVYYSTDSGTTWNGPIAMTPGTAPAYTAYIPAQPLGTTVQYYIQAWDSLNNMATTDTYSFAVNNPVWIWYDTGGTVFLGYSGYIFGPTVLYENPFYGTGIPLKLLGTDGESYDATTANLHIYSYDGTNMVDLITPIPVSFAAQTYQTFDLSSYNINITTPYFLIAYEDIPAGNYFLFDDTYDYGTTFVKISGQLYTLDRAGSWCIGAYITNGTAALQAPVVTITNVGGNPVLNWNAVSGANGYKVWASSDPYAADPWTQIAYLTGTSYTYTGNENMKFFKVTALTEAPAKGDHNVSGMPLSSKESKLTHSSVKADRAPKGVVNKQLKQ